ncbi:MAG TPA: hypothetical protein VE261_02140 [Gaiellaceae bacterium]|nr:hypothetical protein [Gaiellaceae bacterium]
MLRAALIAAALVHPTPAQRLGFAAVPNGPVPGYVMIADRDNNRIIIVSPTKKIVWHLDLPEPDDAFFTAGYKTLTTNQEYNQTIAEIDLRSHKAIWTYGHAGVRGSSPGYLSQPDDTYLVPGGLFVVSDIQNCRVIWINRAHRIVRSIGSPASCSHDPPRSLSSPNGDTPLADGGVLVTEIGGWVDRFDKHGRLLYTVRTPTAYPSDAQLLPNNDILVAGFNTPGRVDEITPKGRIVWSYQPSGYWSLDRPSLAVRWPNGMIAITDDWHHRVVVVDPKTKQVVWSYGHLNQPSSAAGYLSKPDGLDLLPGVSAVAPRAATRLGSVQRVGTLPSTLSKASAVALPDGRLMVLGGETGGASTDRILAGSPSHLRTAGRLPAPTHDAAAAVVGASVYLFGGGQATSVNTVVRVDPASGKARVAGHLDEPLSDLGVAVLGRKAYLVGGYTSVKFASAVLRWEGGGKTKTVGRLAGGTRYAGVAALGVRIYVAGGLSTSGPTSTVWSIGAHGGLQQVASLPAPEAHAALAALGGSLYLVGGTRILRIDPSGSVTVAAHLPVSLTDPAAVTLGKHIVIVGGGTNGVYSFTP